MSVQVARNFARSEFACRCGCGFDTVDVETIDIVQKIRDHFGATVTVHSGCRCASHNARIGGARHSQHVRGRAADVVVAGVAPSRVADYAEQLLGAIGGLGRYASFTHIDTRSGPPARWSQ